MMIIRHVYQRSGAFPRPGWYRLAFDLRERLEPVDGIHDWARDNGFEIEPEIISSAGLTKWTIHLPDDRAEVLFKMRWGW